jgi:hypothetical protein
MRSIRSMNENGIAMVVALVILLVLTLIGFSSISTSTFESSITGNERVGTDAFYAAEAGAQVGMNQIPATTAIPVTTLGADSSYWSGGPGDKAAPKPIYYLGLYKKDATELNWGYRRYQVDATGESAGAVKQVESQVIRGPILLTTEYNP